MNGDSKYNCIYAVMIGENIIKVGSTSNLDRRLTSYEHANEVSSVSVGGDILEAECVLITFCNNKLSKHHGDEWFCGGKKEFDLVSRYINDIPYSYPVCSNGEIAGISVRVNLDTGMCCATDLIKAGNKWRIGKDMSPFNFSMWLKTKSTVEFISELEEEYGKAIVRGKKTWVHPFLFIDLALAISPKLKIEAYRWMYDCLLANRNASGNSYKRMCGSLYAHHGNKVEFPKFVASIAKQIKDKCNVSDWNTASELQLKKRDQIHHDITLLANAMNNNNEAVRLALLQH